MSNYYIGGIGKDFSWNLVSEMPFVVFDEQKGNFRGVATLDEAMTFIESETDKVYAFSPYSANWEEVHFSASAQPTPAIGFKSN